MRPPHVTRLIRVEHITFLLFFLSLVFLPVFALATIPNQDSIHPPVIRVRSLHIARILQPAVDAVVVQHVREHQRSARLVKLPLVQMNMQREFVTTRRVLTVPGLLTLSYPAHATIQS
jgi:hypothetical protein